MTNIYNLFRDWIYRLTHKPVIPSIFIETDYTKPIELTEEMKRNFRKIGDGDIIWYGDHKND